MKNDELTKADRESLLKLARLRERVAKSGLIEVGKRLAADLEIQLDARYPFNRDEVWAEAVQAATEAFDQAQKKIKERSRQLGIPDRFAPSLGKFWFEGGEQMFRDRVIALRRIGKAQIDAMIAAAKRKIEESSLAIQTRIMASALSDEAKAFLEEMPIPEQLMPPLKLGELETMLSERTSSRYALE
jgi:hypothetical protein